MRVMIQEKAGEFQTQFSPPPLLPDQSSPSKCDARSCPWWPYSSSKDFKGTATVILVLLFCALLAAALALNAAFRYLLRRRRRNPQEAVTVAAAAPPPKPPLCSGATQVVEAAVVVYSSGLKLAGQEAECTICLSEFVDGDTIRVLGKCNHGFHVHCIEAWLLASHSNCPTCRACCLSSSAVDDNATSDANHNHNQSNPFNSFYG